MTYYKKYYYWLLCFISLFCSSCVFLQSGKGFDQSHGKDLKLALMVRPQISGPCLASLVGPPSEVENCLQWNDNIDGAPTFEPSRRLIFVGAGDSFLYVLDADSGRHVARIATSGRVVTNTLFDLEKGVMYFGTDKGTVSARDAYSFKELFSFQADSKISNDLMLIEGKLFFTTGLATIYSLEADSGKEYWHVDRPLASERLKLSSNTNLIFLSEEGGRIVAPHPDGYLSVVHLNGEQTQKSFSLGSARVNRAFPDIIAPVFLIGQTLWIASYSNGLLGIDIRSWQVKERIDITNIHQLAHKDGILFAATDKSLYAIKSSGQIIWQNNFFQLRTRVAAQGRFFEEKNEIGKRVFLGLVSRLLIRDNEIIMGTSLGAMGMFDLRNGSLIQVVGNSLGFGPKICFGANSVFALTRRGSVVRF